jgi:fructokinase
LGGAPFNFAVHAARLGHEVRFLGAVGVDERGNQALEMAEQLGLTTSFIRQVPGQPTGVASVTVEQGQPLFQIHRPAAYDFLHLSSGDFELITAFHADWICYGTLYQERPESRVLVTSLIESTPGLRRFYDVNLRANCYTPGLIHTLMQEADVVKLNESEVATIQRLFGTSLNSLRSFCSYYSHQYGWDAVCVSLGARGCVLYSDGKYDELPAYPVTVADAVGAGDAFAAAFLHGLSQGWPNSRIGDFANRVGALVASQRGGTPEWTMSEVNKLSAVQALEGYV